MRAVMYESRKQLKMKVSERRKIHIMAFPHETFLNARWSEDQSAAMPRQPEGRTGTIPVSVSAASAICFLKRDDFSSIRHHALAPLMEHDFSENRYPRFGIML